MRLSIIWRTISLFIIILLLGACNLETTPTETTTPKENVAVVEQDKAVTPTEDEVIENKDETEVSKEETPTEQENGHLTNAFVIRVIDGDTAVVNIQGKEENVRFLLVDSSETKTKTPEPFSLEAKEYLKNLIEGKNVQLEIGENPRDKYDRLLAWVFYDGKSVQEEMIRKGLVKVRYIYKPNLKYLDTYQKAEQEARNQKVGIWSIPGFADSGDDYNVSAVNEKTQTTTAPAPKTSNGECDIKGNITRDGDKIYHVKGESQWYDKTQPEEVFCTEEEASKAGFRKAGR